jgi:hypothetical protein
MGQTATDQREQRTRKKEKEVKEYQFWVDPAIIQMVQEVFGFTLPISIKTGAGEFVNVVKKYEDDPSLWSYLDIKRFEEILENGKKDEKKFFDESKRYKAKPGKLLNKIMAAIGEPEIAPDKLGRFTAFWNSLHSAEEGGKRIVTGEDIRKWYLGKNYFKGDTGGSNLHNSCMRHLGSQHLLDFYCENPDVCSLAILTRGDQLFARTLVWKMGDKRDQLGYDRVYSYREVDEIELRKWLEGQGYKDVYSKGSGNESVCLQKSDFQYYPYLDTFMYVSPDTGKAYHGWKPGKFKELRYCRKTDGRFTREFQSCKCTKCKKSVSQDNIRMIEGLPYCESCVVWSDTYETYILAEGAVYLESRDDYVHREDAVQVEWINSRGAERRDWFHIEDDDLIHVTGIWYHISTLAELDNGDYVLKDEACQTWNGAWVRKSEAVRIEHGRYESEWALENDMPEDVVKLEPEPEPEPEPVPVKKANRTYHKTFTTTYNEAEEDEGDYPCRIITELTSSTRN